MTKLKRKLILLLMAVLLCADILTAFAAESVEWECVPEPNTVVAVGESIAYKLTLLEDIEGWTTLTIRLGDGMSMDSFNFHGAEDDVGEDDIQREIIPGNDGCVILASRLCAGDTAVFTAHFDSEDAVVTARAYTNMFSSDVEHTVQKSEEVLAPEATPKLVAAPEPEQEEDDGRGASIVTGCVCIIMILAALCYAFRRKPWISRIVSPVRNIARRLKSSKNRNRN